MVYAMGAGSLYSVASGFYIAFLVMTFLNIDKIIYLE